MKSLVQLFQVVSHHYGEICGISTIRDFQTVTERIQHEGLSFLTITLPTFSKDFERSLSDGRLRSDLFRFWKKRKGSPQFLRGFLELVFNSDGLLRDKPNIDAIEGIRQLCLMFKKYRAECTPERTFTTLASYITTDLDIKAHFDEIGQHLLDDFAENAEILFNPVLRRLENDLSQDPSFIVPRHGPGTTADSTIGNNKYNWMTWTKRLSALLNANDFLLSSLENDDRASSIDILEPEAEPPVRVITVPKTLKTPRIIAIEPVHMQYVQQGLLELLVPLLESKRMYSSLGFLDQTINQRLAHKASIDMSLATLDLSEASDRVHNELVQIMLKGFPTLSRLVQATRSERADVPGFGIYSLSKFASMGSALCFPIEAMVFLTIMSVGWRNGSTVLAFKRKRKQFLEAVRVYGDDIIVPNDFAIPAKNSLELFGLKVNAAKSFWTGKFRESCGADYYDGESVKPLYVKSDIPTSRGPVDDVQSTVSLRNLFYERGLWSVAAWLDDRLKRIAPFPAIGKTSPILGRFTYLPIVNYRLDRNLHCPIAFGMVVKAPKPKMPLDGYGALMKFFLKRGLDPIFSKDHLLRDGRPRSAAITLRWAPAN